MKIRLGVATLCLLVLTTVSPTPAQIPLGEPFIVNTTTAGDQRSPDVAIGPDGRFVVVWRSEDQDGSGWGVFARWFDWDGTALAHGGADSRELVAVWAEPPSGPIEWDVKARIFSGRIFNDGFESGGTGAWSSAT